MQDYNFPFTFSISSKNISYQIEGNKQLMSKQVNPSFWESQTFYKPQQVLIVGSGIVGLASAYFLTQQDKDLNITILERGTIPTGASTRNAGFACFGSISELISDTGNNSIESVKELIAMRENGLRTLRQIVPDSQMEYQHTGGYEYFEEEQLELFTRCESQMDYFNSIIEEATGLSNTFATVPASKFGLRTSLPLIYNQHEGQLHPAKMISYLTEILIKRGVQFLNGAKVIDITESSTEVSVLLNNGAELKGEKLILATNAFTSKIVDLDNVKPVRNQVYVTKEISNLKLSGCFHCQEGYVYFRNVGNRILIGGARQHFDSEDTAEFGQTQDVENYLLNFIHRELGIDTNISFEHKWSGILAVGDAKKPIIKRISPRQVIGVRMGGMGIAIGSKVGEMLADLTFS